jgi:signal transduction histidine kinase
VRLTQVLTNLLTNAAKYTPTGGIIMLRRAWPTPPVLRLASSPSGRRIAEGVNGERLLNDCSYFLNELKQIRC